MPNLFGSKNPRWRGGRRINAAGYVLIYCPTHPRLIGERYVAEHTLVAEQALGKYLPTDAVVHHVDDDRQNNQPNNLVICEGTGYHKLIHARRNAYRATGNVHARKCGYCHQWAQPGEPDVRPAGRVLVHRACSTKYNRARLFRLRQRALEVAA